MHRKGQMRSRSMRYGSRDLEAYTKRCKDIQRQERTRLFAIVSVVRKKVMITHSKTPRRMRVARRPPKLFTTPIIVMTMPQQTMSIPR
jgi:hypothetical protein